MENFVAPGESLTFTAPSGSPGGTVSGEPVLIGSLLVVPADTKDAAEDFQGVARGVFRLPKPDTEAWTEGAKLYWDDTAKKVTTVVGSPANTLVGAAVEATPAAVGLSNTSTGSPQDLSVADNVLTVNDYTGLGDVVITITVYRENRDPLILTVTEGVDFDAETSNAVTAGNIADAIDALFGVSAADSQGAGSPPSELVTVTVDNPIRGLVRLDGVAR